MGATNTKDFWRNLKKALFQKSLSWNRYFCRMFFDDCVLKNWKNVSRFERKKNICFFSQDVFHWEILKYETEARLTWIRNKLNVHYWFSENVKYVAKQSTKTKGFNTYNQKCKKKQVKNEQTNRYSRPRWPFLKGTETKHEIKTKRVLINKERKQI